MYLCIYVYNVKTIAYMMQTEVQQNINKYRKK